MMEHRLGRRVAIAIPVRLRFGDGTFGLGLAMNVARGGMFVRTSQRLLRSGCVDVRLTVPTAAGEHTVLMPASVVHANPSGIGLMFRALDERATRVLSWLLRTEEDAEQARPRRSGAAMAAGHSAIH